MNYQVAGEYIRSPLPLQTAYRQPSVVYQRAVTVKQAPSIQDTLKLILNKITDLSAKVDRIEEQLAARDRTNRKSLFLTEEFAQVSEKKVKDENENNNYYVKYSY